MLAIQKNTVLRKMPLKQKFNLSLMRFHFLYFIINTFQQGWKVFMTLVILSVCLSVCPCDNLRKNYFRRLKFLSLVKKVFSTYGIENGEFWPIRFDFNPGQKKWNAWESMEYHFKNIFLTILNTSNSSVIFRTYLIYCIQNIQNFWEV